MASDRLLKYPRTPHLPFSQGIQSDDIILSYEDSLPVLQEEVIVTEKVDGGNCCVHDGMVYARSTNSEATHPSFGPIKQLAAQVCYLLPGNIQLFGENMFGIHSIEYDGLTSFFYIFAVLEEGRNWWAWDKVEELASEIGVPTVPVVYRGQVGSLDALKQLIEMEMAAKSRIGSCHPEGFVVRTLRGFPYDQLEHYSSKYVRAGHIQTDESWKRTWKQARLKK